MADECAWTCNSASKRGGASGVYLQDELIQISLNNHILDTLHCNLEQIRVRRIREMSVDFLMWVSVQRTELVHEVFRSGLPVRWVALEVWKTVLGYRVVGHLLFEEVHFVEEEDQGAVGEPLRVGDGFPKHEGFLHLVLGIVSNSFEGIMRFGTYGISVFDQRLVVTTDGDQKQQAVYVLEAVNPLLTLRSLSTNIEHAVCECSKVENRLGNSSRSQS